MSTEDYLRFFEGAASIVADFNGDGIQDFLRGERLYLNMTRPGDGVPEFQHTYPFRNYPEIEPYYLDVFCDYDDDGDIDIYKQDLGIVYINVSHVGIEENHQNSTPTSFKLVSLYPNPFNNQIQLRYTSSDLASLSVYNLLGQQVYGPLQLGSSAGDGVKTFDFGMLSSGTYLLRLQTSDQSIQKKIMLLK
ncbi:T9SS type A sorting domain-containing protein [bacterium]|nr:T9SS type A sorting domain-containing protein [bacterium]